MCGISERSLWRNVRWAAELEAVSGQRQWLNSTLRTVAAKS